MCGSCYQTNIYVSIYYNISTNDSPTSTTTWYTQPLCGTLHLYHYEAHPNSRRHNPPPPPHSTASLRRIIYLHMVYYTSTQHTPPSRGKLRLNTVRRTLSIHLYLHKYKQEQEHDTQTQHMTHGHKHYIQTLVLYEFRIYSEVISTYLSITPAAFLKRRSNL